MFISIYFSTGKRENVPSKVKFYQLDLNDSGLDRIFTENKLFSLPKLKPIKTIELGVKGPSKLVDEALLEIQARILNLGYEWHK